jgi:hypothetical protein
LGPSFPGGQYSFVAAQKSWMASSWKQKRFILSTGLCSRNDPGWPSAK